MQKLPHVTIGIVTYNDEKYIQQCLPTLLEQTYPHFDICIYNNNPKNSIKEKVSGFTKNTQNIQINYFEDESNAGFCEGNNYIIRQMKGELYFCTNIDILYEKNYLALLVQKLIQEKKLGAVTGKLKVWDFESQTKTEYIDTTGIQLQRNFKAFDRGQGEKDNGQYNTEEYIFGASGASILFKKEALEKIVYINEKGKKEYFDNTLWAYKDDIDISYRLQLTNYSIKYIPQALGFHDRSVAKKGNILSRKNNKTQFIRQLSLRNQLIIENKFYSPDLHYKTQIHIFIRKILRKIFVYLFEADIKDAYQQYKNMKPEIQKRKRHLQKIGNLQNIEKWFMKKIQL